MAHDVFISYSRTDKTVADAACTRLEGAGVRCWIAPRDVLPGMAWGGAIVEGIRAARVMVLVFSAEANKSPQVLREVERAVNAGVVVIPFRIEEAVPSVDLEFYISAHHWLDAMTPPLEAHLERLTQTIEQLLARGQEAPRALDGPPVPARPAHSNAGSMDHTSTPPATRAALEPSSRGRVRSTWYLMAFGGLSLTGDDDPGPAAGQRRPLALLTLLAAAGEPGLSRDQLLPYLWPQSDDERGGDALQQMLHELRRDLREPELFRGTNVLSLNPDCLGSDIAELEAALAAGDLERTADLHRGAFLDGFHLDGAPEFSYWVDLRRADYAARVGEALRHLARQAGESGDREVSLRWWRRLAVMDPLDSGVALELMNALVAAGNSAGALQHARIHETLVREELGGPPDSAMAALAARLREGAEGLTPKPSVTRPKAVPSPETPAGVRAPGLRDLLQAELADRYRLERELPHREGTDRTFIAQDTRYSRLVAIKVLHPSLSSALDVERFLQEIALMARLQHPGILPLLDSGEVGGRPWFAAAYPGGDTLRELLGRQDRLPREAAIRIAVDVAGALDYAHRQGVVHRDLRPENILLVDDRAIVANFGIARALGQAASTRLTATGILMGSPGYMSPEQATGEQGLDGRSDVYSLGCILHEMLTSEPVHTGPTPQAILARRMALAKQPAALATRLLPPDLEPVIERALAPRPADRYQTAGELAEALKDPGPHRSGKRVPEPGTVAKSAPAWIIWSAASALLLLMAGLLCSVVR